MSTWTIIGIKPATGSNTRVDIIFFKNGFNVNGFDMEVYDDVCNGHTNFKESIKRGEIPKEVLESKHYHGRNIDYYFQEKEELGESLVWRNYQSSRVQLQDYNSDWPKLYQKERESIHEKFIIHMVYVDHLSDTSASDFIAFRNYLRTHPQDRSDYSAQKMKISSNPLAIKDYAQSKNKIVNDLMDKATVWYRANQKFIHIGTFSMDTNQ
ncbi:unnamed protein product [Rotaria magnacalcarata]|uniref:Uncharacterized protein n=1 Tax=Rotaria magnacalcarata TaxID=392030 RepID=A0A815BTS6_9BILA|nr:unnamed protein product [Rotaria magnacalcarata]CAF1274790.1 unnamed protein product [Rotaria magnacalcarata]CAF2156240.1 unnamed protein product [Rotaria magnacalcarata]